MVTTFVVVGVVVVFVVVVGSVVVVVSVLVVVVASVVVTVIDAGYNKLTPCALKHIDIIHCRVTWLSAFLTCATFRPPAPLAPGIGDIRTPLVASQS